MLQLNSLQYTRSEDLNISNKYSINALAPNELFDNLCLQYYKKFHYRRLKTFAFSKEGFLGLLLELKGKIAISVGETQYLIDGAKMYESLGFQIHWVRLNKDGTINLYDLRNHDIDFLFLSSYVMDTFLQIDFVRIKKFTKATIISNGTAQQDEKSDALYFDNYKLNGFNVSGVLLFNDDLFSLLPIGQIDTIAVKICFEALQRQSLNSDVKNVLIEELCKLFSEDVNLFVNRDKTLPNTVHFGLKGIKARELIRTMALSKIYISNGEGCSLGLSKPSRIIQEMGYDEDMSRTAISLSFSEELTRDEIKDFIKTLYLKYQQIKMLS
ncbi:MAG: cysteine desulfurase [Arcobacteraceae bacterium]